MKEYIIVYTYCGNEFFDGYHEYDDWACFKAKDMRHALEKFWSQDFDMNVPRREYKSWFKITNVHDFSQEEKSDFIRNYWANEPPMKQNLC